MPRIMNNYCLIDGGPDQKQSHLPTKIAAAIEFCMELNAHACIQRRAERDNFGLCNYDRSSILNTTSKITEECKAAEETGRWHARTIGLPSGNHENKEHSHLTRCWFCSCNEYVLWQQVWTEWIVQRSLHWNVTILHNISWTFLTCSHWGILLP